MSAGEVGRKFSVDIEPARDADEEAVEALKKSTATVGCTCRKSDACFGARDRATGAIVGIAEYVRTFPPDEAMFTLVVLPEARRQGIGKVLLRTLAEQARKSGLRGLTTLVAESNTPAWHLLRSAGIPVRLSEAEEGLYVEIDLISREGEPAETGAFFPPEA